MNTANLITLADVRSVVKRWVDNGTCNESVLDSRISEAEARLWDKSDWRLSKKRIRIRCQNQSFPLPIEVAKIIKVDIDGNPANVFDAPYEFMDSGPGDMDAWRAHSGAKDVVDIGEFPTQFEIPAKLVWDPAKEDSMGGSIGPGFTLIAYSPYAEDADLNITIRGINATADEIHTTQGGVWLPGEVVPINRWSGGQEGSVVGHFDDYRHSVSLFRDIFRVYKPVTKGPVSLFAVDLATNTVFLLSKMVPAATIPSYRRYRITNRVTDKNGLAATHVLALVKLRHIPAQNPTDVMAIQNMAAIKNMIKAINFENQDNLSQAQAYEMNAIRLLADQKQDEDTPAGMMTIIDFNAQLAGRGMNHGGYI